MPGSGGTGVSPASGSGAAYSFTSNSDFVGQVDFNTNGASNVASTIRTYEATRDLIDTIENKWSGTSVSKYDYDNDVMGRRTKAANTGTAFSTNRFSLWGYNERSELTSAKRYDCNTSGNCLTDSNTNSPVSGQQFTYTFDNIGNRTEDTGDPDANTTGYTANNLNQYTATTSPTESFTYDNDGNLTQDASWDYTWDAENRLTAITARNPTSGSKKLTFDYDYMNRRWRKRVYTWNTFGLGFWNTTPSVDRKFVYDGWNLIEELNGLSSDAIISRYTWGLDLSGQSGSASVGGIHGAGGIGGLLACNDNSGSKNYIYFYNANGDVGQLMDVAGGTSTPAVKYEYYPYGGELLASGLAALVSPFRLSTKYWDAETNNLYYGERYLRSKMGRWLSRDPVGERGGNNLNVFLHNSAPNWVDPFGLYSIPPPSSQPASQPCECCCCADSISISRGRDIEPVPPLNKYGLEVSVTYNVTHHLINKSNGETKGGCTFMWFEFNDGNVPADFPDAVTGRWQELMGLLRGNPKYFGGLQSKAWRCPGADSYTYTDRPHIGTGRYGGIRDIKFSIYFIFAVRSAKGCKCNTPGIWEAAWLQIDVANHEGVNRDLTIGDAEYDYPNRAQPLPPHHKK